MCGEFRLGAIKPERIRWNIPRIFKDRALIITIIAE
jgi:hypothetical protein